MNSELTEMREREIDLIDMFGEILSHWRALLIVAILGAMIFGIFGYVRSEKSRKEENMALEEQAMHENLWKAKRASLESKLEEKQIADVNLALLYKEEYEKGFAYQKESLLMHLDPNQIHRTDLTFYIQAEEPNSLLDIKEAYQEILLSPSLYDYVQEKSNISGGINELIEVKSKGDVIKTLNNQNLQMFSDDNTAILGIKILYDNEKTCQVIADAIVSYIEKLNSELGPIIGNHKIVLVDRSYGIVSDLDVGNTQGVCVKDLYEKVDTLERLMSEFTEDQISYYYFLSDEIQFESTEAIQDVLESNDTTKNGIRIKDITFGILLFVFIYVIIISLKYIFNQSLRSTDDLNRLFAIPQLGVVTVFDKKHLRNPIDQRIMRMRFHNRKKPTIEDSTNMVITSIKLELKRRDLRQICLMGCALDRVATQICEQIKGVLAKEQIEVTFINNVLYNASEMQKLENAEAAVLMETAEISMYEDIRKEIQLLSRQNILILGGVIVE